MIARIANIASVQITALSFAPDFIIIEMNAMGLCLARGTFFGCATPVFLVSSTLPRYFDSILQAKMRVNLVCFDYTELGNAFAVSTAPNSFILFCKGDGLKHFLSCFFGQELYMFIMGEGSHLSDTTFLIVFTPIKRISLIDLACTSLAMKCFCAYSFVLPSSISGAEDSVDEVEAYGNGNGACCDEFAWCVSSSWT